MSCHDQISFTAVYDFGAVVKRYTWTEQTLTGAHRNCIDFVYARYLLQNALLSMLGAIKL